MNLKETKLKIIQAGYRAVEQLVKVAKEDIIKLDTDDDLAADRLKNAAATKKIAIFDAFEILTRIEAEKEAILEKEQALYNSVVNSQAQQKEVSELQDALNEREKSLAIELADLQEELFQKTLDAEIEAGLAALEHDTQMTTEKIANEERLAKIKEENTKRQAAQELAANQMVLSSISEGADAALSIAENSYSKNKQLILTLFNVKKAATIADIAMSTAAAFQAAFVQYGTFAPIAQAAIIASGVAQAATVLGQQPPKLHTGGMINNTPDERTRTVLTGEAVLDRATVNRIGGESGVNRLQNGMSSEPIVVVTNPYKHFDRFMRDRKRLGVERKTGRI